MRSSSLFAQNGGSGTGGDNNNNNNGNNNNDGDKEPPPEPPTNPPPPPPPPPVDNVCATFSLCEDSDFDVHYELYLNGTETIRNATNVTEVAPDQVDQPLVVNGTLVEKVPALHNETVTVCV